MANTYIRSLDPKQLYKDEYIQQTGGQGLFIIPWEKLLTPAEEADPSSYSPVVLQAALHLAVTDFPFGKLSFSPTDQTLGAFVAYLPGAKSHGESSASFTAKDFVGIDLGYRLQCYLDRIQDRNGAAKAPSTWMIPTLRAYEFTPDRQFQRPYVFSNVIFTSVDFGNVSTTSGVGTKKTLSVSFSYYSCYREAMEPCDFITANTEE